MILSHQIQFLKVQGENMLLVTKNLKLLSGTNIAQQAFCYMSKTFDFHSRHFISL